MKHCVVLIVALLHFGCARAGYDGQTPTDTALTCDAPVGLTAACGDGCICLDALTCNDGYCAVASGALQAGTHPCTGATCSSHGVCGLLSTGPDVYGCACDAGYVSMGSSCVLQGCVADGTRVNRCEQGAVRAFDSCGAEVAVVQDCAGARCGHAELGESCVQPQPTGDCVLHYTCLR